MNFQLNVSGYVENAMKQNIQKMFEVLWDVLGVMIAIIVIVSGIASMICVIANLYINYLALTLCK